MACNSEMLISLPASQKHSNGSIGHQEKQKMGNVRRTVQRTYIGRRSGCTQPIIITLLALSAFVFIFFQMANMIPRKPTPLTFAWASSAERDIAVYVKPDHATAILQPTNLCQDPPFILIVVPSAVNNSIERDTIRRTWGQWAGINLSLVLASNTQTTTQNSNNTTKKPINVLKAHAPPPKSAKLVFLLGTLRGEEPISSSVIEESKLFGDVVVEDFIDSYTNLTLKSVFMLKWVQQYCPKAHYVIKVDDDIFLNVPYLQRNLLNMTDSKKVLSGNLICGAKPIHNKWSKWYTPHYMFREGKYPNYLSGTGYVMSGDLVKPLLDAAITTPYFHLEDVFVTGICAKKIGVHPSDNIRFSYQPRANSPCVYKEVIMGHEVVPVEMARLWNMLNQPNILKKCKPLKKSEIRSNFPGKCIWR